MVRNLSRNGQKTLFYVGCACAGAYVAYRYWKKRLLKTIDEGFEEVSKMDDTNERRILLLGLEGSGKTSLMNQATASNSDGVSYVVPPTPTHGFAVYRLGNGQYTYNVWEIGGAEDTKQYWNNFLQDTDLLLFMVDASSDLHKLSVAVSTFKQLLGDSRIDNVPILVLANKQDAPNALRPEKITEALDLISISPSKHKIEVIGCQTRPLPDLPPGTKEYTWHHPSVDVIKKKIFALTNP